MCAYTVIVRVSHMSIRANIDEREVRAYLSTVVIIYELAMHRGNLSHPIHINCGFQAVSECMASKGYLY